MSVSYLKVICARSWGHIEAFGDLKTAKNKLTAALFLIHNQMNHPVYFVACNKSQSVFACVFLSGLVEISTTMFTLRLGKSLEGLGAERKLSLRSTFKFALNFREIDASCFWGYSFFCSFIFQLHGFFNKLFDLIMTNSCFWAETSFGWHRCGQLVAGQGRAGGVSGDRGSRHRDSVARRHCQGSPDLPRLTREWPVTQLNCCHQ